MDPSKMKVVDLRSELGALGLDTKGNKPALVERLKKALETKTGKALPDTSILDTSTEDIEEPPTPRRSTPAARTTRRSSSSRLAATPAKIAPIREEPPEPIVEEPKVGEPYSPSQEDSDSSLPPAKEAAEPTPATPAPVPTPATPVSVITPPVKEVVSPEPVSVPVTPAPVPAPATPAPVPAPTESVPQAVPAPIAPTEKEPEPESQDEEKDKSPKKQGPETEELMEVQDGADAEANIEEKKFDKDDKMEQDGEEKAEEDKLDDQERELTEEEEWEQLNERLRIREQERLEKERKQAEEDAKRIEEVSNDPIKLNRLKRKHEKKARWSNFYRAVEVTNEVLSLPEEAQANKEKKEAAEVKVAEPEIDDNKITLSWYDSDLNQYLEVPELNGVVPLSDGACAHAWAGTRASHGVDAGRVCYEVRVGTVVATCEITEKEPIGSGLRIGWSTDDSSLHLGEGQLSWGFESTGRAVTNGEFKEYGQQLNEKDVVGAYLDLESNPCKISYTLNGVELGTAFEFDKSVLNGKPVFPHLLTKNMCYKVNFGYDRYNMLTKTKTVRNRVEIPVEQVLEEKRQIEAELQRQKEEAAKKERERREKEKKDREERQRKKREERERQDREKKEKEDAERKERGEEVDESPEDEDKEKEKEKDKESEATEETAEKEEPKENGDKAPEMPAEVKTEPMETEPSEQEPETDREIKNEPVAEGDLAEVTEEQVLQGHVLDKRIKFVIRYTVSEELDGPEADLVPGFVFISNADIVEGPARPQTIAECEVILMVGMPGTGKTYWAKQHAAAHPEKRYNILSTGALFDRMKVDCKPFRASYEGRWDAMVSKCAKCVLKLLEIAKGRKRNFILDQTNVYPSAQRRKLREFDGYRRVAVVIVTDDETYRDRQKRREEADGKEVPDGAIVDMKANFTLPEKCSWLDEVIYPELGEAEARGVLEAYHKEARAAGVLREKDKRERSATRDAPPPKRHRSNDKRHQPRDERRNRDFGRDREDRWGGGGGGGGRWGGGGGGRGASRWGARDSRAPPPNANRFDRPWPAPQQRYDGGGGGGGGDFGRPGQGRGGGPGGGGPGGGGPGGRGAGRPGGGRGAGPPGNDRFGRDRHNSRPNDRPDKRPHPPGGGGGNNGGGAGSWQRGGQMGNNRGSMQQRPNQMPPQQRPNPNNQKDGQNQNQNQNQQNQQGWNQWAGGWGGWGNWNQNQGWGNWGNWGNWNPQQQQGSGTGAAGAGGAAAKQQQAGAQGQQWPANYTAQQWYQWQQWQQQQQQAWPGYQQGNQTGNTPDAQAWAQYYQNYGGAANANSSGNAVTGAEKK